MKILLLTSFVHGRDRTVFLKRKHNWLAYSPTPKFSGFLFRSGFVSDAAKGRRKHENSAAQESLRSGGVGFVIAPTLGFPTARLASRRWKVEGKLAGVVEVDGLRRTCSLRPAVMTVRGAEVV
jgi:hypothetical protein